MQEVEELEHWDLVGEAYALLVSNKISYSEFLEIESSQSKEHAIELIRKFTECKK